MKNAIPRYNFYKTKYGSELSIDVVGLQCTRKFLTKGKVHILTYYDITFITKGEIDSFRPHDTDVLRALLYETLMLLSRAYRTSISLEADEETHKNISSFHLSRFTELVEEHFRGFKSEDFTVG